MNRIIYFGTDGSAGHKDCEDKDLEAWEHKLSDQGYIVASFKVDNGTKAMAEACGCNECMEWLAGE